MVIAQCDSRVVDFWLDPATDNEGRVVVRTPWLKPGAYTVDMMIHAGGHPTDIWEQACHFQVLPVSPYPTRPRRTGPTGAIVFPDFDYLPALRPMATIVITPPKKFAIPKVSELWEAREVLYRFGARDVTLRYRQTLLGVMWVVLQPLLTALIFVLVFAKVAHLSYGGAPAHRLHLRGGDGMEPVQRDHHPGPDLPRLQPGSRVQGVLPPDAGTPGRRLLLPGRLRRLGGVPHRPHGDLRGQPGRGGPPRPGVDRDDPPVGQRGRDW